MKEKDKSTSLSEFKKMLDSLPDIQTATENATTNELEEIQLQEVEGTSGSGKQLFEPKV